MFTSAITAYLVSNHVVAPEERLIFGQAPSITPRLNRNRRWTHHPCGWTLRPLNGEEVVADMAHHFHSHHRFNHVPRPWRHHPPDQHRIQHLRRQLRQIEDDLFALRKRKDALIDALHPNTSVGRNPWSGSQWGTSSTRGSASEGEVNRNQKKSRKKKAETPRNSVHLTYTHPYVTHPDVTQFYHYIPFAEPLDQPPVCEQTKYINLSKISSHNTGSESYDPYEMPVLFDSGANCCITPCKDDFVGYCSELTDGPIVDGIGGKVSAKQVNKIGGETVPQERSHDLQRSLII
jgi:hypothetical protein